MNVDVSLDADMSMMDPDVDPAVWTSMRIRIYQESIQLSDAYAIRQTS
jgi:hypothetical protein